MFYELKPAKNKQKSYYGKARVQVNGDGSATLYSYDTKIITRDTDGTLKKHWDGWTATTGKHIYEFCGLRKKEYEKL